MTLTCIDKMRKPGMSYLSRSMYLKSGSKADLLNLRGSDTLGYTGSVESEAIEIDRVSERCHEVRFSLKGATRSTRQQLGLI